MLESFTAKGLYVAAMLVVVPFLIVKMALMYLLELRHDVTRNSPR